ncbi:MAG: metal ABC transporter permease [Paracoccaceae bacterium]
MLDDFLVRAALAGVGLSLATGPLGAFVVWRRMAYFGDATAHAAILGVALALAFDLPVGLGTLAVALAMGATVALLAGRGWAVDTVLGVMAHSALAFGLVAAALVGVRTDLSAWLFGDILAVSRTDLGFIWLGALAVVALLVWRWQGLLTATVDEDLAQASGVDPGRERLILTLALAVTVAVALKVVGALLIAALLIVPAAAARSLSRTPEAMALLAAGIGAGASLGGLALSLWQDTPAGPSIIVVAAATFAVLATLRRG